MLRMGAAPSASSNYAVVSFARVACCVRVAVLLLCLCSGRSMDSTLKKEEKAADVVVTKKAFNLACSWVQKMSGGADLDVEEESKGLPADDDGADVRPMRLGLGAKYLSHSQANRVSSQVDKKLRAKLIPTPRAGTGYQGCRREHKASNNLDGGEEPAQAEAEDEDDSRASNFKKRSSAFVRPTLIVTEITGSKKKKKKGVIP